MSLSCVTCSSPHPNKPSSNFTILVTSWANPHSQTLSARAAQEVLRGSVGTFEVNDRCLVSSARISYSLDLVFVATRSSSSRRILCVSRMPTNRRCLLQEEARPLKKNSRIGSSTALFVNKDPRNSFIGTCFNCRNRGHRAVDCQMGKDGESSWKHGSRRRNGRNHVRSSYGSGGTACCAFAFTGIEATVVTGSNSNKWLADSGVTSHICSRKDCFIGLKPRDGLVSVANGVMERIAGKGTVCLLTRGCGISMSKGILGMTMEGQVLATCRSRRTLFFVDFKPVRRNLNRVNRSCYNVKRDVYTRQDSRKSRAMTASRWRTEGPVVTSKFEPPATAEVSCPPEEDSSSSFSPPDGQETEKEVQGDVNVEHEESEEEFLSLSSQVSRDSPAPIGQESKVKTMENVEDNRSHLALMSSKCCDGSNGDQVHLRRKAMIEGIGSQEEKKSRVLVDRDRRLNDVTNKFAPEVQWKFNESKDRREAHPVINAIICSRSSEPEGSFTVKFEVLFCNRDWKLLKVMWDAIQESSIQGEELKMFFSCNLVSS